jgi:T3SS negative regulator,GrlR
MTAPTNGLYTVDVEMTEGGRGHATGVLVLSDGKIAGGDSHFYYSGSFSHGNGRIRGELTANQHAKSVGAVPLFGGREVTCGLAGTYSGDSAEIDGTALVGKTSVSFHAKLTLRTAL